MENIKKFSEEYEEILKKQKILINKNVHARELEKRYHRKNHQYCKSIRILENDSTVYKQIWPADEIAFIETLRSKLSPLPDEKRLKQRLDRRLYTNNSPKFSIRKISGTPCNPSFSKYRLWFPSRSLKNDPVLLSKSPVKLFGPKIKGLKF